MGGYIRMYLKEMVWEGVNWIHLDEEREEWRALVNTVTKLGVP
jgi:hypothetical protein